MVKSILDGSKTQTRMPVTWSNSDVCEPKNFLYGLDRAWSDPSGRDDHVMWYLHVPFAHPEDGWAEDSDNDTFNRWYPKYEEGDRLYVREALRMVDEYLCYDADHTQIPSIPSDYAIIRNYISQTMMPRWASRITLEVTDVRVERLLEITAKGVVAEGFPFSSDLDQFKLAWNEINSKRGFGWESNPWCWCITFRRLEAT